MYLVNFEHRNPVKVYSLLARKIFSAGRKGNSTARPVIFISVTGIALGIMAMLLSVMIVTGFRNEITGKVTGFMGHLRITAFDSNNSFEEDPVSINQQFVSVIRNSPDVTAVQPYAFKAGLLKSENEIEGVVLKGVTSGYHWDFFKSRLTAGAIPQFNDSLSTEVLISKNTADKLNLKTGDSFLVFFIQNDRKVRKLKIAGIYSTGLSEEFDNLYILCDLNLIRKINNWQPDEAGGFEVFLSDFNNLDNAAGKIYQQTGYEFNVQSIKELYPQMFNWLQLQNLNVIVIITLIILVAGITMISTLLILVLENSRQIGMLKAMGADNALISKTYIAVAAKILIIGLIAGNFTGAGLAYLQLKTGFISLPEESYYVARVPVNFDITSILMINAGTVIICVLMLLIPTGFIARVDPVKVLRFD